MRNILLLISMLGLLPAGCGHTVSDTDTVSCDTFVYSVKGRGSFMGSISRLREQKCRELEEKVAGLAVEAKSLGMDKTAFVRMAEEQFGGEKTV